ESGVVEKNDQHIGCALGRTQLLDGRELGVGIPSIIGDRAGWLGRGDRKMRTVHLVFPAHRLTPPLCAMDSRLSPTAERPSARSYDAAEPQMAGCRVDHLGIAGGWAIAPAVVRCAEIRSAFDHLARDLGLCRVIAVRQWAAPRILWHAAGRIDLG